MEDNEPVATEIKSREDLNAKIQELRNKGQLGFVPMKPQKIPYNWDEIMKLALHSIHVSGIDAKMALPITELQNTTKNKVRLDDEDRSSPLGVVQKKDKFANMKFFPYASALFRSDEIVRWVAKKFGADEQD